MKSLLSALLAAQAAFACNDLTPPVLNVTAPQAGAVVKGAAHFTATASDDVGVARVEILIDGLLKATEKESPYDALIDTAALSDGAHSLLMVAYDAASNKTMSPAISFTVKNAPDAPPPPPPSLGWSDFKLASDAIQVFVSQSGADSNSGLTAEKPLKTLAAGYAKLRSGKPDQLLLKRGDTFREAFPYWNKSGRSASEPMLISAYGVGTARPIVSAHTNVLVTRGNISFIAVIGLRLTDLDRDPASPTFNTSVPNDANVRWQSTGQFLLLEDDLIDFNRVGIVSEQPQTPAETCISYFKDLRVRRSVIANNWGYPSTNANHIGGHSQGMFTHCVDGLLMEENFWDSNGYHDGVPGAVKTVFNHNVYVNALSKNVVARGNVFSRASATGIQMRAGGVFEGNLVVQNPIGTTYGIVRGGTTPDNPHVVPGGVTGYLKGNVWLEGVDMDLTNPRASALNIGNLKDVSLEDNVFAHYSHLDPKKPYNHSSVTVECGLGGGVGIVKFIVKNNSMWKWAPWYGTSGACKAAAVETGTVLDKPMEKKLADYAPDFFARARLQSRLNWDAKYTAPEAVKYFRAQFGK